MTIDVSALGGSVGTNGILTAKVIEVKSWAEFKQIDFGNSKNKIIFFNGAMDPTKIETFTAYLGAVDQRNRGAVEASKKGAIGVLIRSLTLSKNDIPHTGALTYELGITKIPAVAISTNSANMLSTALKNDNNLTVSLMMDCRQIPNVLSYNVIGEIKGTKYPNEIVTIGAHLDSWDVGEGAIDNGTGVVQTIEALRLIKKTGISPDRTIRAILYMNEESGAHGAKEYAIQSQSFKENHIAIIESDAIREVQIGAAAMTSLALLILKYGL